MSLLTAKPDVAINGKTGCRATFIAALELPNKAAINRRTPKGRPVRA
jgi:hypothetical protein